MKHPRNRARGSRAGRWKRGARVNENLAIDDRSGGHRCPREIQNKNTIRKDKRKEKKTL